MKKEEKKRKLRPLRTGGLINAAEAALAEMVDLPPETETINVTTLAKRIGVSRQAIYDNLLQEKVAGYAKLQREKFSAKTKSGGIRRSDQERIAILEKENKFLQEKIDGWIERWAMIEYNATLHGWDPDLLIMPLEKPLRKTLIFRK
jgi:hypothetical protein